MALLGGLVTPVGAALVSEEVAASGANITFSGAKDEFWGFHVIHGDDPGAQYDTFDVPTRSLSQIKVRGQLNTTALCVYCVCRFLSFGHRQHQHQHHGAP